MGGAKRMLEEIESRGWSGVDKVVCAECISDYALAAAVRANVRTMRCDYCNSVPAAPSASAPVDLILELIVDGLRHEYEDPIEQVLWSSADGGYQMRPDETRELLEEHEVTVNGNLLSDLVRAIQQEAWVQRDPYAASPSDALQWGWQAFRTFVKHRRRYTFLALDASTISGAGEIGMDRMPAVLAEAVDSAGQIRVLSAGTELWRVRVHPRGETYGSASDLGAPPDEVAKDNRMTPKGIGAFYGASTANGALAEVAGYADPTDEGTLGKFRLLRDIAVVDLTNTDDVPSLFDADQRHRRHPLIFMREFVNDVAKIADPSDRQNLDYVPTQVIAEFFRYELTGDVGSIGGILWRSSKDPSVQNSVIFASNEQMADQGAEQSMSILSLDRSSIRTLPAPLAAME